jgi:hypothetical protein
LIHSTSLFCVCVKDFFRDKVLWTICLGWHQTEILLISACWVARITGMSHQHSATWCLAIVKVQ